MFTSRHRGFPPLCPFIQFRNCMFHSYLIYFDMFRLHHHDYPSLNVHFSPTLLGSCQPDAESTTDLQRKVQALDQILLLGFSAVVTAPTLEVYTQKNGEQKYTNPQSLGCVSSNLKGTLRKKGLLWMLWPCIDGY